MKTVEYWGIKKSDTCKFNDTLKTKSTRYNKVRTEILKKLNATEDEFDDLDFRFVE